MSRSRSSFVLAVLALTVLPRLSVAATTFLVTVPASTPPAETVYIAGDFQGWNPGNPAYALTKQPDGRWAITLNFANGQPIQFKFTRGDWGRVEKGPNGEVTRSSGHSSGARRPQEKRAPSGPLRSQSASGRRSRCGPSVPRAGLPRARGLVGWL